MGCTVDITEFEADGITPMGAFERGRATRPGPAFLLESAPAAGASARHSIIGLGSLGEVRADEGETTLTIDGRTDRRDGRRVLDAARELLQRLRPEPTAGGTWRSFLGAYGAAAFEFGACFETLPSKPHGGDPMPDLHLIVPETLVLFDHVERRAAVVTLSTGRARDHRDVHEAVLRAAAFPTGKQLHRPPRLEAEAGADDDAAYRATVEHAKDAIQAGEIYQVALARRWVLRSAADPFVVYRLLRSINPSPYMFFLDLGWGRLLGSSPEVLARLDGDRALVRPLAGTRPRQPDAALERAVERELRRDRKERAEHVMLVDLGRNDLGRTCVAGSVCVAELMRVERFSHVMHLRSEVRGTIAPGRDAFDLLEATFPAGTVTGAPKIRAMEIIAQLERARRGHYAGCVGRFGFDGSMDACITLRSAHERSGEYHVLAGAGIVADSDPAAEARECAAKAGAVLDALRAADGVTAS